MIQKLFERPQTRLDVTKVDTPAVKRKRDILTKDIDTT